jgi:hypothetical protein
MDFVFQLMINAVPMTLILGYVLAVIEDMSFKQGKAMDLKIHPVFILLPTILLCLTLDAKFGIGIQILVLNARIIGISSKEFALRFQATVKLMIRKQVSVCHALADMTLSMDLVSSLHQILLVLLMLVVRLGLVESVSNAQKAGLLTQTISAQLFLIFAKPLKDFHAQAVTTGTLLLMAHASSIL